jgi:hypothetical protein
MIRSEVPLQMPRAAALAPVYRPAEEEAAAQQPAGTARHGGRAAGLSTSLARRRGLRARRRTLFSTDGTLESAERRARIDPRPSRSPSPAEKKDGAPTWAPPGRRGRRARARRGKRQRHFSGDGT